MRVTPNYKTVKMNFFLKKNILCSQTPYKFLLLEIINT